MASCKKTALTTDSIRTLKHTNYITHLNGVLEQFSKDSRMNPTHISLYMALFQLWNYNFFKEEFFVNRQEVMSRSKIGSKSTYHQCIKDLHHWKYLRYSPSHNPYKGSRIKMFEFGTSTGQALYPCRTKIRTSTEQALVPLLKQKQTLENSKTNSKNVKDLNFKDSKNKKLRGQNQDNLRTSEKKNYNKPL